MLIKALCDYADKLEENSVGNTMPDGFSEVQVHFKIRLTKDGNIGSIVDLRKREQIELKNGKTKTTLNVSLFVSARKKRHPAHLRRAFADSLYSAQRTNRKSFRRRFYPPVPALSMSEGAEIIRIRAAPLLA